VRGGLSLREKSQRGKPVRLRVVMRRLGRFGKKKRPSPISRKLRHRRELIQAVRNATNAYLEKRSTFDPRIITEPVHLDLEQGYSWRVTIEANMLIAPPLNT
jgi:hypothetical protein